MLKIVFLVKIKKISLFQVTSLKFLGRVGTHIFFIFFSDKNIILCILKGNSPFNIIIDIFW